MKSGSRRRLPNKGWRPTPYKLDAVRDRLARHGIPLHLAWRPDDAHALPWAQSGYFNFWNQARSDLLGQPYPKDDRRRHRLRR